MKEQLQKINKKIEELSEQDLDTESSSKEIENLTSLVKAAKIVSDIDREAKEQEIAEAEAKRRWTDRLVTGFIGVVTASIPAVIYFVCDMLHRKDEREDVYMMSPSGKSNRSNIKAR